MNFREKILNQQQLLAWRESLRGQKRQLVVTNGCFDILHLGHITYLEAARNAGDALLVGVTSDIHVRGLKGPNRPINNEQERAAVLAALQAVDAVFIFPEKTAVNFLSTVKPDLYVKGGDYTIDTINQEERKLIESFGGKILIGTSVPGKSTTSTIQQMSAK